MRNYTKPITLLESWILISSSVLLVVWALPHTIAARNIALVSGVLAGFFWLAIARPKIEVKSAFSVLFLLALPIWIICHWAFFSTMKDQQWDEIDSTWLRVAMCIFLGYITGLVIARHNYCFIYILLAANLLPIINFIVFKIQIYFDYALIIDSSSGLFKTKAGASYFILCQIFIGFGLIFYIYSVKQNFTRQLLGILLSALLLIMIGAISIIEIKSLNGIIMIGLSATFLLVINFHYFIIQFINHILQFKLLIISIINIIFISFIILFTKNILTNESKLFHLISDVNISTQIEKNHAWVLDSTSIEEVPFDKSGRAIEISTYQRTSWFIRGIYFIIENPLGSGVIKQSFGYHMRNLYPNSQALIAHSAWIDLTLGIGLPGFFLIWLGIILCVLNQLEIFSKIKIDRNNETLSLRDSITNLTPSLINSQLISCCGLWLILGISFYWIVGEVGEREYIEHYFYLIALFSTASQIQEDFISNRLTII